MKKINVVKSNQEFNDVIKTGSLLKNNYFIHAHFQPKEQWVKLYFKDDFKQE